MKRMTLAIVLMGYAGAASAQGVAVSAGFHAAGNIGAFHEALAPHGEWLNVGTYGNVWRPNVAVVGAGFRPYATGGHWVYSDVGWNWMSDYDWGWAPFHYGRWILDPVYGWVWVPDTVWGPAWVNWRYGGGLVGWAPLAPVGYLEVETYHPYWCFVGHEHFVEGNVYSYATSVDYHQAFAVTSPVNNTVMVNGTTRVWAGPPASSISAATGHAITPVNITAPRAGVVAPHSINGVPAPQLVNSGVAVGHYSGATTSPALRPGVGTPGAVQPNAGSRPGVAGTAQPFNGNGAATNNAVRSGMGELHTPPNNPVAPQNPAYRQPAAAQSPYATNNASGSSAYGYHAQPAPATVNRAPAQNYQNRTAPMPTYRSAPSSNYRSAPAPSYRPASSSHSAPAPHGNRR